MAHQLSRERLHEPVTQFARRDFVWILAEQTIGEALRFVRGRKLGGRIAYFYVLDEENRLQGVVPTRRLLLNPPETPIRDIMVTDVIALPAEATLLDACDLFLFHRLLALPVVDEQRRVLGIVDVELYTEEISDLARHAESDDIFQLIGVNVALARQASVAAVFRARFPWLLANIAGGLGCAAIAAVYEQVLDAVVALALFIPIVLALGESVSIQSLTLTLQARHDPRVAWRTSLKKFGRDLLVGLLLGLGCGGLVALTAWLWQGLGLVALCLAIGITLSIVTASAVGVLVPTLFRSARRDPKVASGPITLAVTDLATLFYYLGLAALLLG